MNIQHAILGLLRNRALTGYDMKKAMQKSPIIYWSGNNSQIYRALAELENDGFVRAQVQQGEASPTKKVYTLTNSGKGKLHRLSLGTPELPEIRKTFLMQLVFGGNLTKPELESLLQQYSDEVKGMALAVKGEVSSADNMSYESVIVELALENIRQSYESELAWIEKVRSVALPLAAEASDLQEKGREFKMEFIKVQKDGNDYIKVISGQIREEQNGVDLVAACAENGTDKVMLPADCLSEDFLRLSTRVAGLVLQKLATYHIKAVAVMDADNVRGKFKDFLIEANRGKLFHAFEDMEQAETWLLAEKN
ncbi:DUF4180 domain-containing protein [Paenibacillus pasadenensis]|uniref:DUF4180 domain-containing protein n=1 Tax=Paenibacillus pasadenensis TaxID=217090 RepID=UPI002040EAFE|nr:DUF4180 domain-containing protein [Paenibacillus pasadenensis]MCM3747891.1 DUF4180 domain-containing protein [Paenibacillus pasadenensis]